MLRFQAEELLRFGEKRGAGQVRKSMSFLPGRSGFQQTIPPGAIVQARQIERTCKIRLLRAGADRSARQGKSASRCERIHSWICSPGNPHHPRHAWGRSGGGAADLISACPHSPLCLVVLVRADCIQGARALPLTLRLWTRFPNQTFHGEKMMRTKLLVITAVALLMGAGAAWAYANSGASSDCCYPGAACCVAGLPCCESGDCCAANLSCCPDGPCCQTSACGDCCALGLDCCYPGSPCCAAQPVGKAGGDCCGLGLDCCFPGSPCCK